MSIDYSKINSWHDMCAKCDSCGMDMDMDPFCIRKEVLEKRTAETGQDYPWGLDLSKAMPLCKGEFFEKLLTRV